MGMSRCVAVMAVLALIATTGATAHVKQGDPAPRFSVDLFGKQKITSDQLRGQVVIINRWATWCGPCKKELPELDTYYRQHAKDGLRVFAVTTEDSIPDFQLKPLAAVLAFPLAHRLSGSAFDILDAVPTNYVIDRNGVVRYAKAGAFDAETLDAVVGPLLAEPAPAPAAQVAAVAH
jgi:cytochrome c biogenesis protein CcmG, thiol:disulfide interchange protein DsbE